jgi:hypothetical protein
LIRDRMPNNGYAVWAEPFDLQWWLDRNRLLKRSR